MGSSGAGGAGAAEIGVGTKQSVRVAPVSSIVIGSPGATIDTVTMAAGDRVLVWNNGADSGIYVWNGAAVAMTRASDWDSTSDITLGLSVFVREGSAWYRSFWRLTNTTPVTLGTTTPTWATGYSSSGTGTASERYGASSAAAGANSAALGYAASSGGANSLAVGMSAAAAAAQGHAVGRSATASGTNSTALGYGATASAIDASAIGKGATAVVNYSTAIGTNASVAAASGLGSMAIGTGASVVNTTFDSPSLAVGYNARVLEGRATALGAQARADGVSSTAVGRGAIATAAHAIAIGRGSWANVANMICIGDGASDVYFGSGHTHKYVDQIDGGTLTRVPSGETVTLHGTDAYDATDGLATSVAGGPIVLAGGRGTGTAPGGSASLQVAPAGGVSNNTKNGLVKVVEANVSGTASTLGFYAATPVAKQTGVAVTAAGVHAALVNLGLISA